MSEETEQKEGFLSQLKNQILAGIGVIITTLSTIFIDEIKSLFGVEDKTEEVVIQQPKQEIIINVPEQKKDTIVKKVIVEPKKEKTATEKRKDEGFDW